MRITLVAAMSENRVIGNGGKIPWDLPADMKHFRAVTQGHPIVMGRKTHESIGRVLPGRPNIVITRDSDLKYEGCEMAGSLDEALAHAKAHYPEQIDIIGGGEIYHLGLPHADRLILTIVHTTLDGDAFFPDFSPTEWTEVSRERHESDADHAFAYTFVTYDRATLHV